MTLEQWSYGAIFAHWSRWTGARLESERRRRRGRGSLGVPLAVAAAMSYSSRIG